jgi:MFS family permease
LSITACFIGLSYGTNVTTFYIIAVLLGIASSGGTILVAATLVSNWFVEKRGQVMALVMACSNIGGILGGFFLPSFIDSFGWNMGFVFSAVYFFVLTMPAGMFLVKNSPRNVGLQAFGTNTLKEESHSGEAISKNTHNIDFKQGVKSPLFYLLFIGTALISLPTSFVQHMSAFATDTGVSPEAAGITVVVRSVVAIFATIICGRANDRIGTVKSTTIFLALFMLSFVGFILVEGFVPILITTIVFSAGTGCGSTMPAIIVGTLFGTKDFGKYFSLLTSAMALGVIIGTPLMGKIYDQTSSYNLAFIISIACIVLGLLCLLFCLKKSKHIQPI